MERHFTLECVSKNPCRIRIDGDLDLYTAPKLRGTVMDCLASCEELDETAFEIDISTVDFVDSAGLSLFVHAWKKCTEKNRRFGVVGANHYVRRVLKITGMEFLLGD